MSQANRLRQEIAQIDNKFYALDAKRVAAVAEGDLETCEKIDKEQEQLHDQAERLRGRLARLEKPEENYSDE